MIQGGGDDNGGAGDMNVGDVAQMFGNSIQGVQSAGQCGCWRPPQ
jgi:hypothetical protein